MNAPFWKPLPVKLRLYEALYSLNRGFEATLLSLERLEHLGMFRLENLNAFKVTLEHTRAEANEELIQTLQDYEQEESARFDRMEREWENQLKDPDDVFFAARDRKQEIKDQIKDLQNGLKRQTIKPKSKKKHR
jgi:molecular chaperone DnaK (HSP70)